MLDSTVHDHDYDNCDDDAAIMLVVVILVDALVIILDTPQPLYNTVRYNTVLDITRIRVGPQLVILDLFS